jgi:hypothetical protein
VLGAALLGMSLQQAARCAMSPRHGTIALPRSGMHWLPSSEDRGTCDAAAASDWRRAASGDTQLWVAADGPGGSGRYWTVTVGAGAGRVGPPRGVCLTTTTIGWRTLRAFESRALSFLEDVDGDGAAEFVLWDSFPLREEGTSATMAIAAWAYGLRGDSLVLSLSGTRRMAARIAAAYRVPMEVDELTSTLRADAARVLGDLAEGRCTVSER